MQLHKRQTKDQVKLVLDWYCQGFLSRDEALAKLGVKRRRFYVLLKNYRDGKLMKLRPPVRSNVHRKIDATLERAIRIELENEKH